MKEYKKGKKLYAVAPLCPLVKDGVNAKEDEKLYGVFVAEYLTTKAPVIFDFLPSYDKDFHGVEGTCLLQRGDKNKVLDIPYHLLFEKEAKARVVMEEMNENSLQLLGQRVDELRIQHEKELEEEKANVIVDDSCAMDSPVVSAGGYEDDGGDSTWREKVFFAWVLVATLVTGYVIFDLLLIGLS